MNPKLEEQIVAGEDRSQAPPGLATRIRPLRTFTKVLCDRDRPVRRRSEVRSRLHGVDDGRAYKHEAPRSAQHTEFAVYGEHHGSHLQVAARPYFPRGKCNRSKGRSRTLIESPRAESLADGGDIRRSRLNSPEAASVALS